jgi:hypothetical protein
VIYHCAELCLARAYLECGITSVVVYSPVFSLHRPLLEHTAYSLVPAVVLATVALLMFTLTTLTSGTLPVTVRNSIVQRAAGLAHTVLPTPQSTVTLPTVGSDCSAACSCC